MSDLPPELRALLEPSQEWEDVEYKSSLDLSDKRQFLKLVRTIAAMQAHGGYVVVGVDDLGVPTGLTDHEVRQFDGAELYQRLRKYLPEPFVVRPRVFAIGPSFVVSLRVEPVPEGFTILRAHGTYRSGEKEETVFRAGDIFVRHGSSTERWSQHDIDRLIQRRLEREREFVPIFRIVELSETLKANAAAGDAIGFDIHVDLVLEVAVSDAAVYVRDIQPLPGSSFVGAESRLADRPVLSPYGRHDDIVRYAVYLGDRFGHGQRISLELIEHYVQHEGWGTENAHGHLADTPLDSLRLRVELPEQQRPARLLIRQLDTRRAVIRRELVRLSPDDPTTAEFAITDPQPGHEYTIVWEYDAPT